MKEFKLSVIITHQDLATPHLEEIEAPLAKALKPSRTAVVTWQKAGEELNRSPTGRRSHPVNGRDSGPGGSVIRGKIHVKPVGEDAPIQFPVAGIDARRTAVHACSDVDKIPVHPVFSIASIPVP